jgi:hypothetical protein
VDVDVDVEVGDKVRSETFYCVIAKYTSKPISLQQVRKSSRKAPDYSFGSWEVLYQIGIVIEPSEHAEEGDR